MRTSRRRLMAESAIRRRRRKLTWPVRVVVGSRLGGKAATTPTGQNGRDEWGSPHSENVMSTSNAGGGRSIFALTRLLACWRRFGRVELISRAPQTARRWRRLGRITALHSGVGQVDPPMSAAGLDGRQLLNVVYSFSQRLSQRRDWPQLVRQSAPRFPAPST